MRKMIATVVVCAAAALGLSACGPEPTGTTVDNSCVGHGGVAYAQMHKLEEGFTYTVRCKDNIVRIVE